MSPARIALIANGTPPETPWERAALAQCDGCVCCDRLPPKGAPELLQIVGDCDTLRAEVPPHLLTDLHADQETNDLTKAMRWCRAHYPEATLHYFAVTGRREDHTLANLALIAEAGERAEIATEAGHFHVLPGGSHALTVRAEAPISFLSFVPQTLSATSVVWPVERLRLDSLWRATLNRTTADTLTLTCEAPLLVYQPWSEP